MVYFCWITSVFFVLKPCLLEKIAVIHDGSVSAKISLKLRGFGSLAIMLSVLCQWSTCDSLSCVTQI